MRSPRHQGENTLCSAPVRGDPHPPSISVAEHLLSRAALLLQGGRLALVAPTWLRPLALGLLALTLGALHHRGDLAALGRRYRPPGQSRGLQLVAHGVDQSGEIDEMGDRLGGPAGRAHSLGHQLGRPVVEHGGAADGVEGDGEDGVVQREGAVSGSQVTHSDGLQAGELGRGVAGDGGHGDVGQPHRAVGGVG